MPNELSNCLLYFHHIYTWDPPRNGKFMDLLQHDSAFSTFTIAFSFFLIYHTYISQSKRNTHVLATQWIRFRLANEGRKVLVDLSAKINSLRSFSFHFKWNRCASKIVKYIEIFFCALYIIPNLAVLSTVCNLIVFPHIWYGGKMAKKRDFFWIKCHVRTSIYGILLIRNTNVFSFCAYRKRWRSGPPTPIYIHLFDIVETYLICKLNCLRLKWSSLVLHSI